MDRHLLLVLLIYSFHIIKAQVLLPPQLTTNTSVITETDSVTLNCQTPSSANVVQCNFYTLSGRTIREFPCLKTLTGTELLLMAEQSSPAVVNVTCSYVVNINSPYSDISSITINTPLPPELTVNPAVITETDSVTLNCQTPSSVNVSQCYFYTLSGGIVREFPCLETLTGTELLNFAHQSSPAVVKVTCSYNIKRGEKNSPSPYSDISSVTVNSQTAGTSSSPVNSTSNFQTVTPPPETWPRMFVVVTGCGVAVGVIVLLSAVLLNKNRAGSKEVKRRKSEIQNSETYRFYSTISDEPTTLFLRDMMYSTVGAQQSTNFFMPNRETA